MKKDTQNVQTCFHLLQKVLLEAFQTEVLYFTPPYNDFSEIDHGIPNIMWPDFIHKNEAIKPSKDSPERRFFIVRSNLGFYNIIVFLNFEEEPDFYSIGPFRCEDFPTDFFSNLIKDLNLSSSDMNSLENYYKSFPFVSLISIVNVTKQIVATFFSEFEEISPIFIKFEEEDHSYQVNTQALIDYSADYAEMYKDVLFCFFDALQKGNVELAHDAMTKLLQNLKVLSSQNLDECRKSLSFLNVCCHLALLSTNVHPSYVLKLYNSLREKIETLSSRNGIMSTTNDICHKYCLLVKNYAFPEYSKTIRAVINYINLHIDEELTLALLAERFHKNATSLSSSFTKEVGMNITNYVHQTRINEAIRYFNTTKMSISEVALAVGFQDFAYFSRLFHKQVGCSPREYCRNIR